MFLFATEFGGVMVDGERGWLGWRDRPVARLLSQQHVGYLNARKEQYLLLSLGSGIEVVVEDSSNVALKRRQLEEFK